jgi:hypothetical protein
VEVVLPLEDDAAVEDAEDDDELPFEPDSDSTAENRSCINFLNACRGLWVESVEIVDAAELSEVEFALQFGGWPFVGEGIEIPTWLNACMMLCINESLPPEFD